MIPPWLKTTLDAVMVLLRTLLGTPPEPPPGTGGAIG
jgi:hypothetical protein